MQSAHTQIEFHVLNTNKEGYYDYFAQLAETFYIMGEHVFIYTNSYPQSQLIDDLLWSFKNTSFLPHHIMDEELHQAPILISHQLIPQHKNILIHLCDKITASYKAFSKIIELVYEDESIKQICRQKYKCYQAEGYEISTLKILAG